MIRAFGQFVGSRVIKYKSCWDLTKGKRGGNGKKNQITLAIINARNLDGWNKLQQSVGQVIQY